VRKKKIANRASLNSSEGKHIFLQGASRILAIRELTAEDVKITHYDTDHILPPNMERVLGSNRVRILGQGHHGTMIRIESGETFFLLEDGSGAEEVDVSHYNPPRQAEFLGALLVKPEWREHILGCRAEDFMRNIARFGRSRAVVLYWWDVAASLRTPLWVLIKRTVCLGALLDGYRRVVGGS
jgi:hypothetical protein